MRSFGHSAANVGLAVASLALTCALVFGIGEIGLRWYFGWPIGGQQPTWNEFDERLGWVLRPGEYSYVDLFALRKFHVSINDLGIRNRPISLSVPEGIERISVLGDSFVFSAPLEEAERFTDRLERLGSGLEVVSIGVPGYGTAQEILLLEEMIEKGYEAGSKILIVFFPNDLQDNLGLDYGTLRRVPNRPAFSVNAGGALEIDPAARGERGPQSRWGFLERSFSYRYLLAALINIAVAHPWMIDLGERIGGGTVALPRMPGIVAGWYSEGWPERWRTTETVLEYAVHRMREVTSAEILLVYVPSPFQTSEAFRRIVASNAATDDRYRALLSDGARPQRMLRQFADSQEIPFVDLSSALSDGDDRGQLYFPREGHLTELGSERVAQELARVLSREGGVARR